MTNQKKVLENWFYYNQKLLWSTVLQKALREAKDRVSS